MPKPLVIVESPAKAKTIAGFLGADFLVESSIGHIRDLPRGASEVPAAYKSEPWAKSGLAVDVDNDFKPLYVVSPEKKAQVKRLKGLLSDASEVYLATDEDREGESIAWHLLEVLAPQVPVRRMVFHEITRPAIERAVREWRELDRRLVDAQEARRILDRLFGYEVSPVLWRKVQPRLSAGRVQSVATRLVVERERARMRFRAASFWDVAGTFTRTSGDAPTLDSPAFGATLTSLDGARLATGRDFDESGSLTREGVVVLDEAAARAVVEDLDGAEFSVRSVEERPYTRRPNAPFMTSTLQQEAGRKLRFSAQRTMQVAQRLYENGYITYMRTDSTTLSETALTAARTQAAQLYGSEYVPAQPRRYDKKIKNAQEAHEAIRPAGESFRTPEQVSGELSGDEARLYDLVWKRTVASQMADARGQSVQVRLGATGRSGRESEFSASGLVIEFPGFMRAYVEGSDDPDADLEEREVRLPALAVGDALAATALDPRGHSTQPPARYTEASLVRALEELGIGRPSTYSSIIGTIQDRGYVWKKGTALIPSFIAFAVVALLEQHFAKLVDYGFTAGMEDDLDAIATGQQEAVPWLSRFYFGNGQVGLKAMVSDRLDDIDAREVNSIVIGTDAAGEDVVVRVGRYGPYIQRGEDRASVPEDLAPDELTVERAEELLGASGNDRVVGIDPATGLEVFARAGRYGPYVQLGPVVEGGDKPRTASLLATMTVEGVSLDDALRLLTLPRVVGVDPSTGEEIEAHNGRYGPYLKRGSDTRSLTSEDELFTVTVDQALALFAEPKRGRGQRAPAAPLKELGPDPESGGPVVVREGRFGPYVTDGVTNASLRKGDDVAGITIERAAELLAERRLAGPSKRGRAKKTATKKTAAKKTAAKRTAAKKTAAKKVAAESAAPATPAADEPPEGPLA